MTAMQTTNDNPYEMLQRALIAEKNAEAASFAGQHHVAGRLRDHAAALRKRAAPLLTEDMEASK